MRRIKKIALAGGVVSFGLLSTAGFLLGTSAGLTLLGKTAAWAVDGLEVGGIEGSVLKLRLTDAHYRADGIDLKLERLSYDVSFRELVSGRALVRDVTVDGLKVAVDTTKFPKSPETESAPLGELLAPMPLTLSHFEAKNLDVTVDGNRVTVGDVAATARWVMKDVNVERFAIKNVRAALAPAPKVEEKPLDVEALGEKLKATFAKPLIEKLPEVKLPVNVKLADFEVRDAAVDGNDLAKLDKLDARLTARESKVSLESLTLSGPAGNASLVAGLDMKGAWPVSATLRAKAELPELKAETAGTVSGDVAGRLNFDVGAKMTTPQAVALQVTGRVDAAEAGLPFELRLLSPGVTQDGVTVKNVDATVTGSALAYYIKLKADAQLPRGVKLAADLKGLGNVTGLQLDGLKVDTNHGAARVTGKFDWKKGVTWTAALELKDVNTGTLLFPKAPVTLAGRFETKGRLMNREWVAGLSEATLDGEIRGAPIRLRGAAVATSDGAFVTPGLDLLLGINHAHVKGGLHVRDKRPTFDLTGSIEAPDFHKALPDAHGSARGRFILKGTPDFPILDADVRADGLAWQDMLALKHVRFAGKAATKNDVVMGDVTLTLDELRFKDTNVQKSVLTLKGTELKHRADLSIQSDYGTLAATLKGAFARAKTTYSGSLLTLDVKNPDAGEVKLGKAWDFVYRHKAGELESGRLALVHDAGDVEIAPALISVTGAKPFTVKGAIKRLELVKLAKRLPNRVHLAGVITGDFSASVPAGFATPTVAVKLDGKGFAARTEFRDSDIDVALTKVSLQGGFSPEKASAAWSIALEGGGSTSGRLEVGDPQGKKTLGGTLKIDGLSLERIKPLLAPEEEAHGMLQADLRFAGDLADPKLFGRVALEGAKIDSTKLPFEMLPSGFEVKFTGRRSELTGLLDTPEGKVTLGGNASWEGLKNWVAQVKVDTDGLHAVVPPLADVTVASHVTLKAEPDHMQLGGTIRIPKALVTVNTLPESAVAVSSDEVRLDQPGAFRQYMESKKGTPLKVESNLFIELGDNVRLDAFGLKARFEGRLRVVQDNSTLGLNGQILIPEGQFRAYGQDLIVQKGEVFFSGPVTNPSLNIEAIRNPERTADDVKAGVRVTGTAKYPKVDIFSDPTMPQQEALSYVLRGEGLDPSGDSDNSAITTALIGLGVSQGSAVLGKIGDAVGLEGLGVDTEGVGDSSQVVVSAYVLPGLKVKYGIGIFDTLATLTLRYRLMPQLYVEAMSGVDQAVDMLYRFDF